MKLSGVSEDKSIVVWVEHLNPHVSILVNRFIGLKGMPETLGEAEALGQMWGCKRYECERLSSYQIRVRGYIT